MPELSTFFKEKDSSLGIFYPIHYIIASFPSEEAASQAYSTLRNSAIKDDDVLLVSSAQALQYFDQFQQETGVVGSVMTGVSRALDNDASFMDADIQRAQKGAGFVFVRSMTDEESKRIKDLVTPYNPSSMHWYVRGGIQSLV